MKRKYQGFVVSMTHWDRDWYLPFQEFRMKLVRMINNLLELLRTKPDFKVFVLDGQAIIIEDYLEIHPERENEIRKFIRSGRLVIGPWYVLADEFLVSGESLIRNLLIGHGASAPFGGVMKVGYIPDQFGHVNQIPQILRGFGIDSAIFSRGTGDAIEKAGGIFKWLSADGKTWVFGILQIGAYGNLRGWGVPQGEPNDTTKVDYNLALKQVNNLIKRMEDSGLLRTEYLLFNNGEDHLSAQPMVPELIRYVNRHQDICDLRQGSFEDYVRAVRESNPKLRSYQGELHEGKRHLLLSGVASSRMYLKQKNQQCQTLLTELTDPIALWNWLENGAKDAIMVGVSPKRHGALMAPLRRHKRYPKEFLDYAWKTLLKNHPHDDICGCSIDAVHRDMVNRFAHIEQITGVLIKEGWKEIVDRINTSPVRKSTNGSANNSYSSDDNTNLSNGVKRLHCLATAGGGFDAPAIVVYNPLNWQCSKEVSFEVNIEPDKFRTGQGMIINSRGKEMLADLKITREVVKGSFMAADVPACGYETFYLVSRAKTTQSTKLKTIDKGMENEFYCLKFNPNGTINIQDKETGIVFKNGNLFEDSEDAGDEYDYSPLPAGASRVITTQRTRARIKLVERLPYKISYQVDIKLPISPGLSSDRKRRSAGRVVLPISSIVTLYEGVKRIDFATTVDNRAKDHRLRAVFFAPIRTNYVWVESKFDVIRRTVDIPKVKNYIQMPVGTKPQDRFIDLSAGGGSASGTGTPRRAFFRNDGKIGFSLFNKGLPEYEVKRASRGTFIYQTLFRSVGDLSRNDFITRPYDAGPFIPTPEAQCLGTNTYEYSIMPHQGDWQAAKSYRAGVIYNSGFISQTTKPHDGVLPQRLSFLKIEPDNIVISTIKKGEKNSSCIVRFYNITQKDVEARISFYKKIKAAYLVNMNEERIKTLKINQDNTLRIPVSAKEIITIEIN